MNLGRGGGLKCSYIFIVFAQSSLAAPPFGAPVVAISLPLGLPAQLAPARTPLLRRPRGSHRSAKPRNQLAHASSRSPPRRRLIWASVPPSATTGCVPSPHNAAPHGGDGRRRGFSISHDAVVSVVAFGESLGYLRRPGTLWPPALFSRGGKSAFARIPRLGPAKGRPRRPDCVPAAGTTPLAPATIAPNRLESPPEHPWARRSAVLPWYAGAQSAPPLKSGRNWAEIRV